jgi:D-sedoheptulose 7-phosphate isomerase
MISSLGGIQYFEMDKSGKITATPLSIQEETIANLEDNLLYFKTGIQRDTAAVLGDQKQKTEKEESRSEMIKTLDDIKELGQMVKGFLEQGKIDEFGASLHEHWLIKKRLSNKVSNGQIDEWYQEAMNAGALGGKIMGAGGGGWFMFYVNKNKEQFRDKMKKLDLMEQKVSFDWDGARLMSQQEEKKITTYSFVKDYFNQTARAVEKINKQDVAKMADELIALKKRQGRLFILGIGGSAGNAGHAVNDFRKICGIETYAPTDNVSELTARANDESWEVIFSNWLRGSRLRKDDAIIVFSVGGGNLEKNVSPNIVRALEYAQEIGCTILGVVSRDGGYTKKVATVCVLVPVITEEMITPIAESFQAVVWHGIINHPDMKASSY